MRGGRTVVPLFGLVDGYGRDIESDVLRNLGAMPLAEVTTYSLLVSTGRIPYSAPPRRLALF